MKIIVSHDVDHITVWEHNKDLIIPKFIIRGFIELSLGYISASEIMGRLKAIVRNKWQNLEELVKFDKENNIDSTFFFGMSGGKGLNYKLKDAEFWIKKILQEGLDVGVHGIAFDNIDDIKNEYDIFKDMSGLKEIGIRMHCLRSSNNTLEFLNKTGYKYDTTLYGLENPFKVGDLWEFPLHIMDGYIICKNTRWQNQNLEEVKESTKKIIGQADKMRLKYFNVLFHDRYFSSAFITWKEWYGWMVNYFKDNKFEFVNFKEAIQELEQTYVPEILKNGAVIK